MPRTYRLSKQKPVIFLAFSNDRVDGVRFLRNLAREQREIRNALEKANLARLCEIVVRSNATLDDILDVFQEKEYRHRIAIFHYGGHADCYKLLLETVTGARSFAFKEELASFLARQKGLKLIFLNACSTEQHAKELIQKGIPAVIGTSEAIDDQVATQLAIRFYNGIANGFTLEGAWLEAEDDIKIRKGSSNFNAMYHYSQQEKHPDCFPWEIYFGEGAEEIKEWNLPGAVKDFLFGLPAIPRIYDLPEKPFVFLENYQREHAEVFFGRSYYIRGLYTLVTEKDSPPIILLYGQSGVGKSSLLQAGLLPRLEDSHNIIYIKRDQQNGLCTTLEESLTQLLSNKKLLQGVQGGGFLEKSPPGCRRQSSNIAEIWKEIENQTGKPLLVVIDQMEELFTHPNTNQPNELGDFIELLISLFGNPMIYPGGKLILSYRKEYHPEIDKQLGISELNRAMFFLQSLDRHDIIEIVKGLMSTKRLKERYNLEVEDQLPRIIADDLLEDRDSSVAPTLQILLTKMWDNSKPDEASPIRKFSTEQYLELKREGLLMEDFFNQQMEKLKHWNAEVVDSGLALDVLKFHTTPLGTARSLDIVEIKRTYSHRKDMMDGLIDRLKHLYLLTDTRYENRTGLVHDTLAPIVIKEYNESDKPGQRASHILASRIEDFKRNPDDVWLNQAALKVVEIGRQGMRALNAVEEKLLQKSREENERQERIRKRNKRIRIFLISFISLLILAVIAVYQWKEASKQKIIRANYLALQARQHVEKDPTAALCLAENARKLHENDITSGAVYRIFRENTFYKIIARLQQEFKSAVFSRDGEYIIASFYDGTSRVWNLHGQEKTGIEGNSVKITGIESEADDRFFITGSEDGIVHLWDLAGNKFRDFIGHEGRLRSYTFSPDGRFVLTGSFDRTARLWDMQGNQLQVLRGHQSAVTSVKFSPDGRYVLTGTRNFTLRLWELKDIELKCFLGHKDEVYSAVFSPDGKCIFTGSTDGTVRLWDLAGKQLNIYSGHENRVTSIAVSGDGKYILVGAGDGTIRLWLRDQGERELWAVNGHEAMVTSVVFSPQGQRILTASYDKTLRLWDLQGNELQVYAGHKHRVTSAVFSPDSKYIVTGSYDSAGRTARLWDLAGNEVEVFRGQTLCVTSAVFSPDGKYILTGSFDRTARLWGLMGNELQVFKGHRDIVYAVAFSPDRKYVLTGSADKTARLWDLKGNQLQVFKGHENAVHSVAFSPDGKKVLTGSFDGTARLWKINKLDNFFNNGICETFKNDKLEDQFQQYGWDDRKEDVKKEVEKIKR